MPHYSGYQYLGYLHSIAQQEIRGRRTPSFFLSLIAAIIFFGCFSLTGMEYIMSGEAGVVFIFSGLISAALAAANYAVLARIVTDWRDACYWYYLDNFAATDMLLQVFDTEWPEALENIQPRIGGKGMLISATPRELARHHSLRQRVDYFRVHYRKISYALRLTPYPRQLPGMGWLKLAILVICTALFLAAIFLIPSAWSFAVGLTMLLPAGVVIGGYQTTLNAIQRHSLDLALADAILGPGPAEFEDGSLSYHVQPGATQLH